MILKKNSVEEVTPRASSYPAPHEIPASLSFRSLGDAGGLTQYGIAHETLHPGGQSSHMHWESHEDEFLYMLEGALTVIEDGEETVIGPGDACAWKAGVAVGHTLRNHTDAPAVYLIMGSRHPDNTCTYPGIDLLNTPQGYTHLDGTPYPKKERPE